MTKDTLVLSGVLYCIKQRPNINVETVRRAVLNCTNSAHLSCIAVVYFNTIRREQLR